MNCRTHLIIDVYPVIERIDPHLTLDLIQGQLGIQVCDLGLVLPDLLVDHRQEHGQDDE